MKENGLAMWEISNNGTSVLIKEIYGKKLSHLFQGSKECYYLKTDVS
jgi:hypothetical protein